MVISKTGKKVGFEPIKKGDIKREVRGEGEGGTGVTSGYFKGSQRVLEPLKPGTGSVTARSVGLTSAELQDLDSDLELIVLGKKNTPFNIIA